MQKRTQVQLISIAGAFFVFALIVGFIKIPVLGSFSVDNEFVVATTSVPLVPQGRVPTYLETPESVRGIYMTSCVAGSKTLRDKLIHLVDTTELNSLVIDIKTYSGHISFDVSDPLLKPASGGDCFVSDMQDLIDELHAKKIYVIGRIAVFQDMFMVGHKPELAVKKSTDKTKVWKDRKGVSWIDAGSKEHWDYIIALAKESRKIGFDELNFDYIRFPSDGDMKDIYYPKSEGKTKSGVIESFFSYLHNEIKDTGAKMSADLFGMTTTNIDDLSIGQVLERALPYFDYIAPMVYPSHYPNGFANLGDPNKHPYEVVKYAMDGAVRRTIATSTLARLSVESIASTTPKLYPKESFDKLKMRPWLQDNNYPVPYTAEMVRAQIQATYDAGLNSWMLWNASNRYTREALKVE